MNKSTKFSPEVRERAVRMVQGHRSEYPSLTFGSFTYRAHGPFWGTSLDVGLGTPDDPPIIGAMSIEIQRIVLASKVAVIRPVRSVIAGVSRPHRKSPDAVLEARVGIEPASTALQAAA